MVLAFAFTIRAYAGEADVLFVKMIQNTDGSYFVEVTVKHADSGWKHYANWWRISTEDGQEIGRRVLLHPHVNEQPFTRGLDDVQVPAGVSVVIVEAHDMEHEYGGVFIRVDLLSGKGQGYRVIKSKSN